MKVSFVPSTPDAPAAEPRWCRPFGCLGVRLQTLQQQRDVAAAVQEDDFSLISSDVHP